MVKVFRHFFLFLLPITLLIGGCSRSHLNGSEEDYNPNSDTVEEVRPEPEPEPADPTISFNTAEEAIRYMTESEDSEKYLAGILPTMAEDELTYCTKLLNSEHPHFFIVDKAQLEIVVFDRYGREEKRVGMACSKNYGTKHKRRDNRTPEGFFSVKRVYDSTEWLYTDDDGKTSEVKGQFGPRFIRLNIPVTSQIGIHGTCAPWSIGHRRSHGCIRVTNDHIMELIQYVDSGMPVIVSPGSRDMAVNAEEGYYVPSVATRPHGFKASPRGNAPKTDNESNVNDTTVTTKPVQEAITGSEQETYTTPDSISAN